MFSWSSFFCYLHTSCDWLHYYQHLIVLAWLSKMSLSLVKKAVQRTEDGLTGSLVPDVWEVDHVFSKLWHSQGCILLTLKSRVGLIDLRKAQEAERQSTVQSWEGFCGQASLGFCVTQSWVKVQYWMNNGSTSISHFKLIFHRTGWSPLLKDLGLPCCKLA